MKRECPEKLNETSCRWTLDTKPQYRVQPDKLYFLILGNNSLGTSKQYAVEEHFKIGEHCYQFFQSYLFYIYSIYIFFLETLILPCITMVIYHDIACINNYLWFIFYWLVYILIKDSFIFSYLFSLIWSNSGFSGNHWHRKSDIWLHVLHAFL